MKTCLNVYPMEKYQEKNFKALNLVLHSIWTCSSNFSYMTSELNRRSFLESTTGVLGRLYPRMTLKSKMSRLKQTRMVRTSKSTLNRSKSSMRIITPS